MLLSAITIAITTWIVSIVRRKPVARVQLVGVALLGLVVLAVVAVAVTRALG